MMGETMMLPPEERKLLLDAVTAWAKERPDVAALALVGSLARNEARPDSDVDLVCLMDDPAAYRLSDGWLRQIHWEAAGQRVRDWRDADYGALWSRHIRLQSGLVVEMGFAAHTWAATGPVDAGTARVVRDGCVILVDKAGLLAELVETVTGAK
jgi:uncharacterized protein